MSIAEKTIEECSKIVNKLRSSFFSGRTKTIEYRQRNLNALKSLVKENEGEFIRALQIDLGRSEYEAVVLDLLPVYAEIDDMLHNFKTWMKPTHTTVPAFMLPAESKIISEPFGVCLIISPFNYPVSLAVS